MKRTLIVALVVIAVVAFIAGTGYVLLAQGMPDNARSQLDRYLAYRYPPLPPPIIRSVSHATRPWFFKADQSGASYGDSVYYVTTVHYGNRYSTPIRFPATLSAAPDNTSFYLGGRALPFPPEDLWCVRLDVGEQRSTIVLVALHQDLYGADWVVHEMLGTWSDSDGASAYSEWGCTP